MSDAPKENATVPPPNVLLPTANGLSAWKASFETITVDRLPNGSRHVMVTVDGDVVYCCVLDMAQAEHLAGLLLG